MVLTRRQVQLPINKFNNINITNWLVQMAAANDTITPFEGKINPVYPTGLKIYLQTTKEIDKETNKIDI